MNPESFRNPNDNRKRGAFLLILKIIKPVRRIIGKLLHERMVRKIHESMDYHIYRVNGDGRLHYEAKMCPIKNWEFTHVEGEFFLDSDIDGASKICYYNGIRKNSKVPWLDKYKKK